MNFVILDHQPPERGGLSKSRTGERHFDLMFEVEESDKLKTFALETLPLNEGEDVEATKLDDHRREYLNYEGPVSDNRGTVSRIAEGSWSGDMAGQMTLTFDASSARFAGQIWHLRFDGEGSRLYRIS